MSTEQPGSEYAQRARRVAEGAARRAAAPLLAVRQQRQELDAARVELEHLRAELGEAQAAVERLRAQLHLARRNADPRRAPAAVEQDIERVLAQEAAAEDELNAADLRDLALTVGDLDENRAPGVVVLVGGDPRMRSVLTAALAADRVVLSVDGDDQPLALDEPVALAYLASSSYDATLAWLQQVAPLLVSGGRIVVDPCSGATEVQKAVDEYFRDRHMDFRWERRSRVHVVRR